MPLTARISARSRREVENLLELRIRRRIARYSAVFAARLDTEIKSVIRENFETNRPTGRRRVPGQIRLVNAFEVVKVSPGESFPIKVEARPKARALSNGGEVKIRSLLNGSRPHQIKPRTGKKFLTFPWIGYSGPHAPGSAARILHATGAPNARAKKVNHPGTKGVDVIGIATQRVRRRLRSTNV